VYVPAVVAIGLWIVIQVISQFGSTIEEASGIAYLAHIGGFATGVLAGFLFRALPRSPVQSRS
jgi:membrane associated rhomboid family serine protease